MFDSVPAKANISARTCFASFIEEKTSQKKRSKQTISYGCQDFKASLYLLHTVSIV